MASAKKDFSELVRWLKAEGYEVSYTGTGHYKVLIPGQASVFMPSTCGGGRGWQNCVAHLRRSGIPVPRKK